MVNFQLANMHQIYGLTFLVPCHKIGSSSFEPYVFFTVFQDKINPKIII